MTVEPLLIAGGAVVVATAGAVALAKSGSPAAAIAAGRGRAGIIRRNVALGRQLWSRRPSGADLAALARVARGYTGAADYDSAAASLVDGLALGVEGPWPWSKGGVSLERERELAGAIVDVAAAVLTTPPNPWGENAQALAEWIGGPFRESVIDALDTCGEGGWLRERLPYGDYDWPYDIASAHVDECEAYRRERRRSVPVEYRDGEMVIVVASGPFQVEEVGNPVPAAAMLRAYRTGFAALGRLMVGRWGYLAGVAPGELATAREAAWIAVARIGT